MAGAAAGVVAVTGDNVVQGLQVGQGPTTAMSSPSVVAYHSTLFEDFQLTTDPIYNFYTQDEQVAFDSDLSSSLGTSRGMSCSHGGPRRS